MARLGRGGRLSRMAQVPCRGPGPVATIEPGAGDMAPGEGEEGGEIHVHRRGSVPLRMRRIGAPARLVTHVNLYAGSVKQFCATQHSRPSLASGRRIERLLSLFHRVVAWGRNESS